MKFDSKKIVIVFIAILIFSVSIYFGFIKDRNYQTKEEVLPTSNNQLITGDFSTYWEGESDGVKFKVTTGTKDIQNNAQFTFANDVEKSLGITSAGKLGQSGCDYISGKAQVIVNKYYDPDLVDDVLNSAELVSVNKIIQPAKCNKGTVN